MQTYTITREQSPNGVLAFEIENAYIEDSAVARILQGIDGVTDLVTRKLFVRPPDIHVRFKYFDLPHVVSEPWADSSRYWIGPEDPDGTCLDLSPIETAFRNYRPSWFRQLLGDLISLKFLAALLRSRGHDQG